MIYFAIVTVLVALSHVTSAPNALATNLAGRYVLLSLMTTGTSAVTVPVEVWIILLPTVNLTTVFLPVNVTVRFASLHTMSESETPHAFAI